MSVSPKEISGRSLTHSFQALEYLTIRAHFLVSASSAGFPMSSGILSDQVNRPCLSCSIHQCLESIHLSIKGETNFLSGVEIFEANRHSDKLWIKLFNLELSNVTDAAWCVDIGGWVREQQ